MSGGWAAAAAVALAAVAVQQQLAVASSGGEEGSSSGSGQQRGHSSSSTSLHPRHHHQLPLQLYNGSSGESGGPQQHQHQATGNSADSSSDHSQQLPLLLRQHRAGDTSGLLDSGALSELSYVQLLEVQEIMQNWSVHVSDPQFDMLRQPAWRGLVIALYITIILVGTIGNSVVVFVVVKNKAMHTVTNIFIANLALSDIGLCVFSLPIQLYYQLTDHWVFGESLCRVIFAAFAVPMYVSTLTILLIAFDRYWLIVYPLRERMPLCVALVLILAVSIMSAVLAIPVICFTKMHTLSEKDLHVFRHYCIEEWPSRHGRLVYSITMFLLQFCTPLIATTLLYYKIYCRLRHRTSHRVVRHHDRKQKTNKLLVAIVTLFIICWLPWTLFSLVTEIDNHLVKGSHFKFVDVLLRAFAMGSACVNPFLYCWLNENFRKELDNFAVRLHIYKQSSQRGSRNNGPPCRAQAEENHTVNNGSAKNGLLSPEPHITIDGVSTTQTQTMEVTTTIQRDGASSLEPSPSPCALTPLHGGDKPQ